MVVRQAAGKAWRANAEALSASWQVTLQPGHPSPRHGVGTSHQLGAPGCALEGMDTRRWRWRSPEEHDALGEETALRGGARRNMGALVLTCALLAKTQTCKYYLQSHLLVYWPNLYWIRLRFLQSWSELICAISMSLAWFCTDFLRFLEGHNSRACPFRTRIYQFIQGQQQGVDIGKNQSYRNLEEWYIIMKSYWILKCSALFWSEPTSPRRTTSYDEPYPFSDKLPCLHVPVYFLEWKRW